MLSDVLHDAHSNPSHENALKHDRDPAIFDIIANLRASLEKIAGYENYLISDFQALRRPVDNLHNSEGLKRLSELSILVTVAKQTMPGGLRQHIKMLEEVLTRALNTTVFEPSIAQTLPVAQLLLRASPPDTVKAQLLLLNPGFQQLYRDPATELCYRHLLSLSRGLPFFYWWDLDGRLLCNNAISPQLLRRCDVYSFTHEIFYLTNFGARPLPEEVNAQLAASIIRHHVQRAIDLRDDDLLMELLTAGLACNTKFTSWESLMRNLAIRADEGWFLTPNYSLILANRLRNEHRRHYQFMAQYHPMIVWCLLLLSLISAGINSLKLE